MHKENVAVVRYTIVRYVSHNLVRRTEHKTGYCTVCDATAFIIEDKIRVFPHPPYLPALGPCVLYLFLKAKINLKIHSSRIGGRIKHVHI